MVGAWARLSERWRTWRQAVREFFYGFAAYDVVQHLLEMRAATENLFIAALFGDLIGLPIMPPYYSLRLLPYVVPILETWKRRVLREREFVDEHEYHLHGL
ncbi:MAG: hypothetical protein C4313_07365 [Thermoflexus sp.]|uniref:hypothetical protein n=1 Tax=Thermoflexus sp. TaxID=1969742 RepID=UPI003319371B